MPRSVWKGCGNAPESVVSIIYISLFSWRSVWTQPYSFRCHMDLRRSLKGLETATEPADLAAFPCAFSSKSTLSLMLFSCFLRAASPWALHPPPPPPAGYPSVASSDAAAPRFPKPRGCDKASTSPSLAVASVNSAGYSKASKSGK